MAKDKVDTAATVFIGGYLVLKVVARSVWYRAEHERPGFLRHYFVIRTLDLLAILCFLGASFMLINGPKLWRSLLIIAGLFGLDVFLKNLFLNIEARRLCAHKHHGDLKSAKRRLRRRARQESGF